MIAAHVDIADDRKVTVDMTLTTPNCPSAAELPAMVENAVASVPRVGDVKVQISYATEQGIFLA
jgi:metal-sulfur cluster biosynthetic enzyme